MTKKTKFSRDVGTKPVDLETFEHAGYEITIDVKQFKKMILKEGLQVMIDGAIGNMKSFILTVCDDFIVEKSKRLFKIDEDKKK